jgi:hypothetical protein
MDRLKTQDSRLRTQDFPPPNFSFLLSEFQLLPLVSPFSVSAFQLFSVCLSTVDLGLFPDSRLKAPHRPTSAISACEARATPARRR